VGNGKVNCLRKGMKHGTKSFKTPKVKTTSSVKRKTKKIKRSY